MEYRLFCRKSLPAGTLARLDGWLGCRRCRRGQEAVNRATLRRTSDQLKRIRKHVANGGHVDQMQEVDALVGLAKEVADRQLAGFEGPADENDGSVQDDDDAKD
ncbi:hypothetical protein [Mesorhizobium sp.]|uniref:hypothetical protein n=1 Tax=Mesorhizobium sp. TaxID=1871066 RepID=UPI000FE5596A|nr:hypothetical protein [Mesorhizobium sp.]RWO57354.1 MAG: hypothetical protein EOS14_24185 [Mesorhizobium sp.]